MATTMVTTLGRGVQAASMQTGAIRVYPPAVDFKGIEAGTLYCIVICIQNASQVSRRVRIIPPANPAFRVNFEPGKPVAPGIDVRAEVEFRADEEVDYADKLTIVSGSERVEVPLRAFAPAPAVEFDGFADLGVVVVENKVSKVIEFRNVGHKRAEVTIKYDESLPVTISPTTFFLAPKGAFVDLDKDGRMEEDEFVEGARGVWKTNVKVELDSTDVGVFRTLANVDISDQASRVLDITSTVVEQRLELVLPDGGGQMTNLHFGTLMYGQQRTVTALLVNNGPNPATFHVSTEDGKEAGKMEEIGSDEEQEFCPITVLPLDGTIEPYGQLPLNFSFRPENTEKPPPFRSQVEKGKIDPPIPYELQALVKCPDTGQEILVDVTGQASKPVLRLDRRVFKFGECPVHERRDILLKIKNPGDTLPLEWSVNKVANFRIAPSRGRLQPMQSQNVVVSFVPSQLGRFNNTLHMVVAGGVLTIPLRLSGTASSTSRTKKTVSKGRSAPPAAFRPKYTFINPEESKQKGREDRGKGYTRPLPWSEMTKAGDVDVTQASEELYTFSIQDMEARADHRQQYNTYLVNSRMARQRRAKAQERAKTESKWDDPVNLGLNPKQGLDEPKLAVPQEVEPLWLARPIGDDDAAGGRRRAPRKHRLDANRMIRKKFKPRPTSTTEERECSTILSATDLQMVTAGPKVIDFGSVCVQGTTVKSFTVVNDLPASILVNVNPHCEELKNTTPASQVIPSGSTAGFDITLRSDVVQEFRESVVYVINESHSFKFTVVANIVPISVDITPPEVFMVFPEESLEPSITNVVTLTNTGNANAAYEWELPDGTAFTIAPPAGIIPAFKSCDAVVTFTPAAGAANGCHAALIVDGAAPDAEPPLMHIIGECEEAKLVSSERKLDFGNVAVGLTRERATTLKNTASAPAVFWVDPPPSGLVVVPDRGRLEPGATQDLTVTLSASAPHVYDERRTAVVVNVRGAKPLALPVSAAAVMPEVEIVQEEFDFGEVTIGSSMRLRVTVDNAGVIPAIIYADLSKHGQFSLAPPLLTDDMDAADNESVIVPMDVAEPLDSGTGGSGAAAAVAAKFKLTVPANGALPFDLVFTPTSARSHEFELPLSLAGMPNVTALRRVVTADGVEPRLLLSTTVVNFENKIVSRDQIRKVPYHLDVDFSNAEDAPLTFELDTSRLRGAFSIEPASGELQPGERASVRVNFLPTDAREYGAVVPLYMDGKMDRPYLELTLKGVGMYAQLTFDRREVVLPTVPLGVVARATFHVLNCGYDNLELRVRMPSESTPAQVPLQLSFPDGHTVGIAKQRLPVEVAFMSHKAMAFTANIDFLDEDGNKYTLPVSGITDNCLLTTFPFIMSAPEYMYYATEDTPVLLLNDKGIESYKRLKAAGPTKKKKKGKGKGRTTVAPARITAAAAGAGVGSGAGSRAPPKAPGYPNAYAEVELAAASDVTPNPPVPEHSVSILVRWLNQNLLKSPITNFPDDLTAVNGRPVFEIVEGVSGRSVPGRLHRLSSQPRERIVQLLQQYREMLTFLKTHGALLHHVRPEQLLKREPYVKVRTSRRGYYGPNYGEVIVGTLDPSQALAIKRKVDSEYAGVSLEAWTSVVYQIIRVFVLSRINLKQFATLPGVEPGAATAAVPSCPPSRAPAIRDGGLESKGDDGAGTGGTGAGAGGAGAGATPAPSAAPTPTNRRARRGADPCLSGSNLYSVSELVLLKWLTYHHNKINPAAATRIVDFDTDLRDGTALILLILSHSPPLAGHGRVLETFHRAPVNEDERLENAEKIVEALSQLGLTCPLTAEQIATPQESVPGASDGGLSGLDSVGDEGALSGRAPTTPVGSGNPRDMLLLVVFLYQTLPQLIPKTSIEFRGVLGHTVTKTIELRNPGRRPIIYQVLLDGAPEFKVLTAQVRLEPDGMLSFPIECTSRFSRPAEARLTFRPRRSGGTAAATMVFVLRSVVHSRPPIRTLQVEVPTYTQTSVDVDVANPFNQDVRVTVSLVQEQTEGDNLNPLPPPVPPADEGTKKRGGRGKRRTSGKPKGAGAGGAGAGRPPVPPAPPAQKLPDAFQMRSYELNIPAGGTTRIPVSFLPFAMGKYRAQLVFLDENVGEFVYEIHGSAVLPEPLEVFRLKTELKPSVVKDLNIPAANPQILAARKALAGATGPSRGRTPASRGARGGSALTGRSVATPGAAAQASPTTTLFDIEINSPYFECPAELTLVGEAPEPAPAGAGRQSVASRARNNAAAVKVPPPTLETPRGGAQPNRLPLTFRPRAAGLYACKVVLRSPYDIRVLEMHFDVTAPGVDTELEFAAPARQVITQDIPIVNGTDVDWNIVCAITGSKAFKGSPSVRVPRNGRATYTLKFQPDWVCDETAELVLTNRTTGDVMKFTLKGVGQEPLAEDHVLIKCQARERIHHTFAVHNPTDEPVTYSVESDLPHVSGASEVTVLEEDTGDYKLTIHPQLGGVYTGSVTFVAPDGRFQWYTIEVQADAPEPEDKLAISAQVRKAVSVEISLANPLTEEVEFEVTLQGEGLLGDPTFRLGSGATATYDLLFSPLTPGKQVGAVTFVNEKVGEFWYELTLSADAAPPVELDTFSTPVGTSTRAAVRLENPTSSEVVVKNVVDNRRNWSVSPAQLVLAPYSSGEAAVVYTPSALDEEQAGTITFTSPVLGEWVYLARGVGTRPGRMESVMVTAPAGLQTSASITFRNPFPSQLDVNLRLESASDGDTAGAGAGAGAGSGSAIGRIFTLLKKARNLIPPFASLQIPFAFAPPEIAEIGAQLVLDSPRQGLQWTYPIRGVAEAPPSDRVLEFTAQARTGNAERLSLVLPGLGSVEDGEEFSHELVMPEDPELAEKVAKSVTVVPVKTTLSDPSDAVEFEVRFEPMRPFSAAMQFIVNKKSGGRWRYEMRLEATEPEPDDVIVIEANLNHTSSVAFDLTNQFPTYAPFQAYFTLESPTELTVHPPEGVLPPYGSEGVSIVVSFTCKEYGKSRVGKLIVETEDMRWSYEVRGTHPEFRAPDVGARVEHKLDKKYAQRLDHDSTTQRNIMRDNMRMSKRKGGRRKK